jgi:hypothetical protein
MVTWSAGCASVQEESDGREKEGEWVSAEVRAKRKRWAAGLFRFFSPSHLFFFLQNYFREKHEKALRKLQPSEN